jgi:hypothetical protein
MASKPKNKGSKMEYEEAIQSIQVDGFEWALFREYFPFGDISLREGNYQKLVTAALEALSDQGERSQLMALLDAQAAVFLEQAYVQNEAKEKFNPNIEHDGMEAHFASAWIQINSNLSSEYNLPRRQLRLTMLELGKDENLADKICV